MRNPFKWLVPGLIALLVAAVLGAGFFPQAAFSAQTGDPPLPDAIAAFNKGGCIGCHTIPGVPNAVGQVGPNLSTIGTEAGSRIAGLDAEGYIRQSILEPAAFIAPLCPTGDCPADVMPPNMSERLTGAELDAIVGYLLTLSGEGVAGVPTLYELIPIEIVRPAEASVTPFAAPPTAYEDAQVLLGQYLFFDKRISGDATMSCATCHQPEHAFANSEAMGPGYTGTEYFRNAPTVMNTVYNDGFVYWDGRLDATDLPTLVRDHITEAHFMNQDGRLMVERIKQVPEYVQLFQDATGSGPSFGGILKAITAYVHSLNSGVTPYDLYLDGDTSALSEDAAAGLDLFQANCASCHSGPTLSDGQFHNLGIPDPDFWADPDRHIVFRRFFRQLGVPNYRNLETDPGLFAVTKEEADWGAFRTAPLREVSRTAPYMHNGAFASLNEVVQFYNFSLNLELNGTEIGQLVAFLESLSSEPAVVTAPPMPEYQLRTLGENR